MLCVESDEYLNTQMCLHLLAALRHTKWFRVIIILLCCASICSCNCYIEYRINYYLIMTEQLVSLVQT